MNTKKLTLSVLAVTVLIAAPIAATSGTPKSELMRLAQAVEGALLDSQASPEALDQAQKDLTHALQMVNSTGPIAPPVPTPPSADCTDFAYSKYLTTTNSANAMNQAVTACKQIADLAIAKFLWEKYNENTNASNAMNQATTGSTRDVAGKLDVIQFAWQKYFENTNASNAANQAVQVARRVAPGSLNCLTVAWSRYVTSTNASNAMNQAADACAPN